MRNCKYEFFNILKEYNGIIGTILGSVATLITTHVLKGKGKVKFYVINKELHGQLYTEEEKKGDRYHNKYSRVNDKFIIQLYNSCDSPKILRDIHINFKSNGKDVFYIIPKNEDTRILDQHFTHIDDFTYLNLQPKEITQISLSALLYDDDENVQKVLSSNSIHITCIDDKNKKYDIILAEGNFPNEKKSTKNE